MEKSILVLLSLFLGIGAAFAQAPADSSKIHKSPSVFPRIKFKGLPENYRYERRAPDKNRLEALNQLAKPKTIPPEDVTSFYSNMPMAKFKGRPDSMPSAKANDSTVHHHLLKKRFKVMPIPSEAESVVK